MCQHDISVLNVKIEAEHLPATSTKKQAGILILTLEGATGKINADTIILRENTFRITKESLLNIGHRL